jgi:hypothetical protein
VVTVKCPSCDWESGPDPGTLADCPRCRGTPWRASLADRVLAGMLNVERASLGRQAERDSPTARFLQVRDADGRVVFSGEMVEGR